MLPWGQRARKVSGGRGGRQRARSGLCLPVIAFLFCAAGAAVLLVRPPRAYADRLNDVMAYCNALPDAALHYHHPISQEAIEERLKFYFGPCWHRCAVGASAGGASGGGMCPAASEVERVKRELRKRGSGPGFHDAFPFAEGEWGFDSFWANVWPRFWPPSLMLYGYEFYRATVRAGMSGSSGVEFFVRFGDKSGATVSGTPPVLGKARRSGEPESGTCSDPILFKMGRWRHFSWLTYVDEATGSPPFGDKRDFAVWRGVTTGPSAAYRGEEGESHPRASLVTQIDRWDESPILDVGVTRYVQGVPNKWGRKGGMSRARLAQHKMIILAEGNDVSSGLKWALLSGSAVLMPAPTIDSWAMETLLQPWVHYIPVLTDFTDLEEKARWCLDHLDHCEAIAKQAACHMARHLDEAAEAAVERQVLDRVARILALYA